MAVELSTLGDVIATAYESQPDTNKFNDVEKSRVDNMSAVAMSGSYTDLTDKPVIPSGTYEELTGRPTLSAVATSGAYSDLTGTPALGFVPLSQKGASNGVAPLDAAGLVPLVHLNVSGLSFKGAWNPTTNTPTLINGTGSVGDFYKAGAAGTFNFGNGDYTFAEGDWVIFAAGVWQRLGSSDSVSMVNGQVGAVVLTAADIGALADDYEPQWSEVTGKPTLTNTVNGQSGTVVLTAASVGALPNSYVPTWSEVTGKPDLPPSQRGIIGPAIPACRRTASSTQSIPNGAYTKLTVLNSGYDQFGIHSAGNFVPPSWATHIRITGVVCVSPDAVVVVPAVYRNGVYMVRTVATNASGTAAAAIDTGIFATSPADTFDIRVWQGSSGARSIVSGDATWVQIELYEAVPA